MVRAKVQMAALLLAALGLYLVGNASVQLMDRDEPRYAQCSRQMLQSGDWVVPRLFDDIRAKKPPLIYWCQASVMRVLGDTAFAARLPSVLAIFGCACLLAIFVWRIRGPQHALWTTLVFCSSALVIVAAKSSMTDGVLLLWTVIGQGCVYAIWRQNRSWGVAVILAIAIALGLLTKGLIAGVLLATILVLWAFGSGFKTYMRLRHLFSRDAQRSASDSASRDSGVERQDAPLQLNRDPNALRVLHRFTATQIAQVIVGLTIVVCMVGPWVYLVHQRSPEFLGAMAHEARGHALQGKEGHGGPPGMHLLFIWADFLPWSLLLPTAIVVGWMHRNEPMTRFALASVIGPWLMVEFAVRTKLPEYMLPTMPGLAFLTADAIVRGIRGGGPDFSSRQFVGSARIWGGVIILIGLSPWLAALRFRPLPWVAMSLISIGTIVWSLLVVALLRRRRGVAAMGIGMMCVCALLFGVYLPRAQFLRLSILTAEVLRQHGVTAPGQSLMIDYKEPSLAFYQGGTIREQLSPIIVWGQYAKWTPWMVITRDVWMRSPEEVRGHLEIIAHFRGLAIADAMRDIDVMVVRTRSNLPLAVSPR